MFLEMYARDQWKLESVLRQNVRASIAQAQSNGNLVKCNRAEIWVIRGVIRAAIFCITLLVHVLKSYTLLGQKS